MCSGKNGAGSPQGGYNPAATGGMQQFTGLQNQYKRPDDASTGVQPYNTGNPSLMAQGGMASKSLGMPGGSAGAVPVSSAQNYSAGSGMDQNGYGTLGLGAGGPAVGAGGGYGTGGGDPYVAGRPTNTNGDPGLGAGYVLPEMGLLGGGPVGGATRTGGSSPQWAQNPNLTADQQAQLAKARKYMGEAAAPWQGVNHLGGSLAGQPVLGGRPPGQGVGSGGWHEPVNANGGWANNQYNPANRDPNGPANRMAGAAAYQQSLTPEMIQQQINNGQRAPTSSVQMEAMLANMSPEAKAAYLAQSGYRTPTTGGNIFGN